MTLALVGAGLEAPEKLEGLGEIYRSVKSLKKTQTWSVLPLSPSGDFLANFVLQKEKKKKKQNRDMGISSRTFARKERLNRGIQNRLDYLALSMT